MIEKVSNKTYNCQARMIVFAAFLPLIICAVKRMYCLTMAGWSGASVTINSANYTLETIDLERSLRGEQGMLEPATHPAPTSAIRSLIL